MVQSAMMFALGVFVSGLAWLALSAALVRRARRLTHERLMARISTRRAEFEAERDELRARHAVEIHRLDREMSRVLDVATAHRLEADVKDRDLVNARAELTARNEEIGETQQRLAAQYEELQDLERRHAEASTQLRTAQHALQQETARRTAAEEALDELEALAAQRRIELSALRAENEALRATIAGQVAEAADIVLPKLPLKPHAPIPAVEPVNAPSGASVVPLPIRPKGPGPAEPQPHVAPVETAQPLQRLAGEVPGEFGRGVWRAPARGEPRMPHASNLGESALAAAPQPAGNGSPAAHGAGEAKPKPEATPETRFFEALAEIRALKRAASQPGE
jgi:hypothetical protein